MSWKQFSGRALAEARESTQIKAVIVLIVLNVADLILSVRAFSQGAKELNPFMNALFETNVILAAFVKVGMVSTAAILLLTFRHSSLARVGTSFATMVYGSLFIYHLLIFRF